MAKSKYEYVKSFELEDKILPNTFIVVRVDGQNFHRFAKEHEFTKPNDERAIRLMNQSAKNVLIEFNDIVFAYGQSDEFSFVFRKSTEVHGRRSSKLSSMVVSLFTSNYVYLWSNYFDIPLKYPPSFDSRAICYPALQNLRDYISWRQVDCHINNLYNTCFWNLVISGQSCKEAESLLMTTNSAGKNELLFSMFKINYNDLPQIYRKGTALFKVKETETLQNEKGAYERIKTLVCELHDDLIQNTFWDKHPIE